jgi:D-alanyl-D-alanine carboxypeptidase (penicillin-binding protein 5/6)
LSTSLSVVIAAAAVALSGPAAPPRPAALLGPAVPRPAATAPAPAVSCAACIVVDDEGRALWSRRPSLPLPNASTTKMVTALALTRVYDLDLGAAVEISANAAETGGGGLDLARHEVYSAGALLQAMLLTSSNDASVALAEHAAGTEGAFVATMNRVAARLGARDTHFVTPHGLDAPGHHSSAADLARIGAVVVEDRVLAPIVARGDAVIEGPEGTVSLENRNPLIESYRGAVGIKTGFTDGSGQVLVAAARRHGRTLVAVAMRARDAGRDARRLLDYGFGRLARAVLVERGIAVGEMTFVAAGSALVVTASEVRGWAPPGAAAVEFVPDEVRLPVAAGDEVGVVEVRWRGRVVGRTEAVAEEPAAREETSELAEGLAGLLRVAYAAVRALGGAVS